MNNVYWIFIQKSEWKQGRENKIWIFRANIHLMYSHNKSSSTDSELFGPTQPKILAYGVYVEYGFNDI